MTDDQACFDDGSVYEVDFFFDAGSGGVLWARDPAMWDDLGHTVDLDRLPVGGGMRQE